MYQDACIFELRHLQRNGIAAPFGGLSRCEKRMMAGGLGMVGLAQALHLLLEINVRG